MLDDTATRKLAAGELEQAHVLTAERLVDIADRFLEADRKPLVQGTKPRLENFLVGAFNTRLHWPDIDVHTYFTEVLGKKLEHIGELRRLKLSYRLSRQDDMLTRMAFQDFLDPAPGRFTKPRYILWRKALCLAQGHLPVQRFLPT